MITTVTKSEILEFSGRLTAGIFANPTSGNIATGSYSRQQIISQVVQDTVNAFVSIGISIDEDKT